MIAKKISLLIGLSVCFLVNDVSGAALEGESIVGGEDSEIGEYAYTVSLQIRGKHYCGGSIIGERHVITAAHCVVNGEGEFMNVPIKVLAGSNDLKKSVDAQKLVNVVQVYVPEDYNAQISDIAVLKLREPLDIESNPNLDSLELPKDDSNDFAGTESVVSGFGVNSLKLVKDPKTGKLEETDLVSSGKLRYTTADVIASAKCQTYYKRRPINEKHICAFVKQRKSDEHEGVCSEDSGGPLAQDNVLVGVLHASPTGCREDRFPAVYTRVSAYLDFIDKAVNDIEDDYVVTETLPLFG